MIEQNLAVQLKGLEAQMTVLKARMKRIGIGPYKSFAKLYGLLAGKVTSTEEDIEAVKYRLKSDRM